VRGYIYFPSLNGSFHADGAGGDWAGSVYGASGCPGDCVGTCASGESLDTSLTLENADYVNNNPGAFASAYFEILSVRVYE
jgi:hypothetical protein